MGVRSGQRVPLGPASAWVVLFCAMPRSADPLRPHLVVAVSHAPSAQPLHADLDAEKLPGHLIDDALHPRPQTGSLAVVVKDERCGRDLSWAGGRAGEGRERWLLMRNEGVIRGGEGCMVVSPGREVLCFCQCKDTSSLPHPPPHIQSSSTIRSSTIRSAPPLPSVLPQKAIPSCHLFFPRGRPQPAPPRP